MVDAFQSEQSRPSGIQKQQRAVQMSEIDTSKASGDNQAERGKVELSKSLIKNLFKWSFYYSQGNPIMQKDIFRVLTYYHPDLTPELLALPEAARTTAQYVSALSRPDTGLHDEAITFPIKDARDRQNTMKIVMERSDAYHTKDADLLTFMSDWIRRDLEYVSSEDGRPHRNVLRSDIFGSQFFNVLFLGEEPKPGYEHMMHDVRALMNKFMTMDRQSFSRLSGKEQERIRALFL